MLLESNPPFPCHFGVIAEELGHLRYSFLEASETAVVTPLAETVAEYQGSYLSIPGRSALIVFVQCDESVVEHADYEALFWRMVQSLHDLDAEPWPANMPDDPEDPYWEFCFGGEPIIINGHAPTYVKRRTRHSSAGITLVIQTRLSLDRVVGRTATSEAVRRKIRLAINEYDAVPVSPELGTLGHPGVRAWKEYWLLDTNVERDSSNDTCPLKIRKTARA
jgi:FPC/CPF motif-containing protein YcgG